LLAAGEATRHVMKKADLLSNANGWGGRDRTAEWRNQDQMNTRIKSMTFLNFILRSDWHGPRELETLKTKTD
jgi:hypothetical protein